MAEYVLKFYRRKNDTPREEGLQVSFTGANDREAIAFIRAEYGEALESTPFAMLLDAEGRELWRHGTRKVSH